MRGFAAVAVMAAAVTAAAQTPPREVVNWTAGVSYTYDGSGNLVQIGEDRFAYDGVSRLTAAEIDGLARTYGYDAFGNRVSCAQGSTDCQLGFTVDARTNRLQQVRYDPSGNVERFGGHTFAYDALQMETRDDQGATATEAIYTADDERIAVYETSGLWGWTVRDVSGKVLRELTSSGRAGTGSWQWSRDYVYRDALLLASRQLDSGAASTDHYHLDHLGTPRRVTDDFDRLTGFHDYHAFGPELAGGLDEPSPTSHKYTGHERDATNDWTGPLDYMHARYYSPAMGRFSSPDAGRDWVANQPQSWNLYTYVRNSPMMATDPTGRLLDFLFKRGARPQDAARFLNSHLHGETATVDPNTGRVTLTPNGAAGPPTAEQQAFSETLHAAIDRQETVTMTITNADPSVRVGQYVTGTVDLADVSQFRASGAGSAASVFAHEVAEQTAKQIFHLPNTVAGFGTAHLFGDAAQSYVAGYTRGATSGALDSNGSGMLTTTHTNERGQTVVVRIEFRNGNVVRVFR